MSARLAGSDTTSTSLSYFFWELSRRGDIMRKLRSEIDEAMPNTDIIPDIAVLQQLPYLNAFIKEGLCAHVLCLSQHWKLNVCRPSTLLGGAQSS